MIALHRASLTSFENIKGLRTFLLLLIGFISHLHLIKIDAFGVELWWMWGSSVAREEQVLELFSLLANAGERRRNYLNVIIFFETFAPLH